MVEIYLSAMKEAADVKITRSGVLMPLPLPSPCRKLKVGMGIDQRAVYRVKGTIMLIQHFPNDLFDDIFYNYHSCFCTDGDLKPHSGARCE